ncbi:hypothetical protein Pmani_029243 [Petrolisthes manimaculis]|uniref:Uncharacterized protein n=1 Tax=Petrolisthes manimaculis TaxID=1843537 RepID=A0AAE1TU24_9EUCA|nr:hypothetical protein Pmani_029243 [Petrolisthes manimaculis]
MYADTALLHAHAQTHTFSHAPVLDRLCLHSRLGCVLAGGLRVGGAPHYYHHHPQQQQQHQHQHHNTPQSFLTSSPSQVSAEAAVFVAVIVVFYAAIILILLGTNMRNPRPSSSSSSSSSTSSSKRPGRPRTRCKSKHHQVVLDPRSGSISTQRTSKKKTKQLQSPTVQLAAVGAQSV